MAIKCPRCGLINPRSAQRCDCGYDFKKKTVEKAYYIQKIPRNIKTVINIFIVQNILGLIRAITYGNIVLIGGLFIWTIAVYAAYIRLLKKDNWARIVLIFLTFPWGLILALSLEVKLYCMQKD